MIIANPIFDVVFKLMMENEKVAKFFISTLIDETVENIELKPQEFAFVDELVGLSVYRLDFVAVIKTKEGEQKKILIEIQKAKNLIDLMRFRNYLAEQYKKQDVINGQPAALPITTIYILGFKLPEIESACIKVERSYKDLVENKYLTAKSEFVEKLTHESYVVQVQRIADRYLTRLDKLLSIFAQKDFAEDNKTTRQYHHVPDIEELKITTDILHYVGTDPEQRKKIELEQEAWRSIDAMLEETKQQYDIQVKDLQLALGEKENAILALQQEIEKLRKNL